jgi:hypothetical protein
MDVGLWRPSQIEADVSYRASIGPLRLCLKRGGEELHFAAERHADLDGLSEPQPLTADLGIQPEDLNWARWVVGGMDDIVRLTPATLNRPLVVRPEEPLRLPSKQEALFFVNFPIWVRISAAIDLGVTLCRSLASYCLGRGSEIRCRALCAIRCRRAPGATSRMRSLRHGTVLSYEEMAVEACGNEGSIPTEEPF